MVRSREGISVDDAFQLHIGEFGRAQQHLYVLLNLMAVLSMCQIYSMVFTELNPLTQHNWECVNRTDRQCMSLYKQRENMVYEEYVESFCNMTSYEWMWTQPHQSIVQDFNLVCHASWKLSAVKGMFFGGFLIGASLGYISDRIGRKKTLYLSVALSGIACMATSLAPAYWWYLIARTLTGVGCGSGGLSSFVLISEFLGPSKRGRLLIASQMFSSIGSCLITGLSYYLPDWRKVYLIIGVMTFLFLTTWDMIMESPRWLLIKGRKGEATAVLAAIASGNRTKLPDSPLHDMVTIPSTARSFLQIFKHPTLRSWFVITLLAWCSVSLSYYGLSMAMEFLPGSIYMTFLCTIVIEFPAIVFYMFTVDLVGRKPLYAWGYIFGGVTCGLLSVAPKTWSLVLAVLSRFAISGVYAVAFLYTSEIFPTVVRNASVGYASASARIGGILGSFLPVLGESFGSAFPFIAIGVIGICVGVACFFLPETLGIPTPETVEDMDQLSKSKKKGYERLDNIQLLEA